MNRSKCIIWLLLVALSLLPFVEVQAQTINAVPVPRRQFLELHSGYTGGRFAHYTDDYAPKINLFGGGGNSQTGQLVEHQFDGILLGTDFVQQNFQAGGRRSYTLLAGLDVLAAIDHLSFADGHRTTLPLTAAHPHIGASMEGAKWLLRGQAGLLLGRVGYFARTTSVDILSSRTVVDTVHVLPTFSLRGGWSNWVLLDGGYGNAGLLGLANPVLHMAVGTGFGRRSPVAVLFGITSAESTSYDRTEGNYYFVQVEAMPTASRWRASGFFTFADGTYSRVGIQAAYRLPLRTAKGTTSE